MPYKDPVLRAKKSAESMKRWRSNPENVKKANEKRNTRRDEKQREKDRQYYLKNKEKILARCKIYNKQNPDVSRRANKKAVALGKHILRGKRDRAELRDHYVVNQIKKAGSDMLPEEKKIEILIYRVKKYSKKHE